jgi:hypothetical protein
MALEAYKDLELLDALFRDLDPRGKKILDTLIENGACQIEISSNIVTNMIGAAAATNNPIILKYLLTNFGREHIEFRCYKLNENIHQQEFDGNEGKTPLMFSIDNEDPLECLAVLIKAGANTKC